MKVTLELTFNEEVDPQSVADAVWNILERDECFEGVIVSETIKPKDDIVNSEDFRHWLWSYSKSAYSLFIHGHNNITNEMIKEYKRQQT